MNSINDLDEEKNSDCESNLIDILISQSLKGSLELVEDQLVGLYILRSLKAILTIVMLLSTVRASLLQHLQVS